jgi:hypothetical protein
VEKNRSRANTFVHKRSNQMSGKTRNDNADTEISEEASKRMCQHMNDDHAVSVYVMAKSLVRLEAGWKISDARLKKVSLTGCSIQAITCHKDMCVPHNVVYKFEPPLKSSAEARSRLLEIHQRLTKPKLQWFFTKPISLFIVPMWLFAIWGSQAASQEDLVRIVDSMELSKMTSLSKEKQAVILSQLLSLTFIFTLVGHLIFTLFVVDKAKGLKLSPTATVMWMVCIFSAGYPFFSELFDIYEVYRRSQQQTGQQKKSS